MAPEQVFCERGVDGRADLWSLGVMQRSLLGRLPVDARTLAELMKRLTTGTVRRFDAEVPPSPLPPCVGELVDRLLSIEPDLRATSAEVMQLFGGRP